MDNQIIDGNVLITENLEVEGVVGINSGTFISDDLNTNNQNCFGLFASRGNMYSEGNIYISNNLGENKYIYLENNGTLRCDNIVMNDIVIQGNNIISIGNNTHSINQQDYSISIGNNSGIQYQESNSIIINSSFEQLDALEKGLYINPIREELSDKVLNYNTDTHEITFSNYNLINGSTGPTGSTGYMGPTGFTGPTGPPINISRENSGAVLVLNKDNNVYYNNLITIDNNILIGSDIIPNISNEYNVGTVTN